MIINYNDFANGKLGDLATAYSYLTISDNEIKCSFVDSDGETNKYVFVVGDAEKYGKTDDEITRSMSMILVEFLNMWNAINYYNGGNTLTLKEFDCGKLDEYKDIINKHDYGFWRINNPCGFTIVLDNEEDELDWYTIRPYWMEDE